jgi:hypothetical protein
VVHGSLYDCGSQYMVPHCATRIQQARLSAVDFKSQHCFDPRQAHFHLFLRDMDCDSMHFISQSHATLLSSVAEPFHQSEYAVECGHFVHSAAWLFLLFEHQVVVRFINVQDSILETSEKRKRQRLRFERTVVVLFFYIMYPTGQRPRHYSNDTHATEKSKLVVSYL